MRPGHIGTILATILIMVAPAERATASSSTARLDVLRTTVEPPAPVMTIRLDDDEPVVFDLQTRPAVQVARSESSDGRLRGTSSLQDGAFLVHWDLAVDADPRDQATLVGTIALVNRTDVPVAFDAVLSMPLSPLIDGPTRLGGKVEVTLENDGDGGRLEVEQGDALVRILFDDVEVHRMHRGPFVMGGPSAGRTSADAQFGAPMPSKEAGPLVDALGCRMKAVVTSGDQVTMNLRLVVAGDREDFIRRRSTAPVRIESLDERRVIQIGAGRSAAKGRSRDARGKGKLSIAPTSR